MSQLDSQVPYKKVDEFFSWPRERGASVHYPFAYIHIYASI